MYYVDSSKVVKTTAVVLDYVLRTTLFGKQILEQVQRAVKWEINTVVLIQEKLFPFKYRCQNVS